MKLVSPAGSGLGLEETFIQTFNAIHPPNCEGISALEAQLLNHKEVKKKMKKEFGELQIHTQGSILR